MTFTISIFEICVALTVIVWGWALLWPSSTARADFDFAPLVRIAIAVIATPTIWFFWALLRKG